ncbi:DNA cytosine methyltransferase [Tepidiforma flava]|uniref:DNA (cytosine-5-)-methyltransferase n=1 Tax=Tepidiforma flava TaxID=3004094 RepID=A0ABY7MB28_9CHLR|nr:DNA cytosine methyltransferase [Tepidiforma flava]WBL37270.1 DNA cytosine methyltransferase [Tepidiforma flava]
MSHQTAFSVVSLFSGCGGFDLGFVGGFTFLGHYYPFNAFAIIWANDIDPSAARTYSTNVAPNIIAADVRDALPQLPSAADLVIGGFPCQDVSINGKRQGLAGKRTNLYTVMLDVISQLRPRMFVAENVKSLLFKYNRTTFSRILADFASLGYTLTFQVLNAADFGVPQIRERLFIVGTHHGIPPFTFPTPTHTQSQWITSHIALSDLEDSPENPSIQHIWSRAKPSPDQGKRQIARDRPATTIRAEHHGNIQFHYLGHRRLSLREAARLQSFPDSFIFHGGMRAIERQIGNAVPPVLAWHVATACAATLTERELQTGPIPRPAYQLSLATSASDL